MEKRRPTSRNGLGAIVGLVSSGVAIGFAQLVAGAVNPQASPIITVGQGAVDASPEWLKSFAIRNFGSNDKLVLLTGVGAVIVLLALALGVAAARRTWIGLVGLAAFGAVGLAAALTRPAGRGIDALPVSAGVVAGAIALIVLMRSRVPMAATAGRSPGSAAASGPGAVLVDRRRFFVIAAAGAAVAAFAGESGSLLARRFRADDSRAAVRIPRPASPAATPAGLEFPDSGLGSFFTPNSRFYRVDTALLVPSVRAEDWRLRIHGMVDREITLDYVGLLARPLIERDITLNCVSNPIGGHYIGNARWIGAPLRDLLREARVHPDADQIVTRSVDGFTVGTPTATVMDGRDAMLAVAMNGEPLPIAHGFPVRMLVPGLYGYVSATKWVTDMELTRFDAFDAYWIRRGWAQQGPVKTMSRIDTPGSYAKVPAGAVTVAGVAWAQHKGIDRVEVSVDDGPWAQAGLGSEDTIDTWRLWVYQWQATSGDHRLSVRATDRTGMTQIATRSDPFPSGATGQHTIVVRVS